MTSIIERAHAKINLYLRVLAQEASGYPNGYHGIETLFQRIALHDVVRVTVNNGESTLECSGPAMPDTGLGENKANLAWKAAEAYVQATGWSATWQISIEKHIPVGGGLGGGSADAAAVLRALEQLSPTPVGQQQLISLAGKLGADVPFLVSNDSLAWAWNRGDRFLALEPLPSMRVALVAFDQGVNTGQAYQSIASTRRTNRQADANNESVPATRYPHNAWASWESIIQVAHNDFEPVVLASHSGVAHILPQLQSLARQLTSINTPALAMLTGSGATCFFLYSSALTDRVDSEIIRITHEARETQPNLQSIQTLFSHTTD